MVLRKREKKSKYEKKPLTILQWNEYCNDWILNVLVFLLNLQQVILNSVLFPVLRVWAIIKNTGGGDELKSKFAVNENITRDDKNNTVESIVWEIPGKQFPTYFYTYEDILELIHSIRGQYDDLHKSTEKLDILCSQIEGMAATVNVVFLSKNTKTEDCVLETVRKHLKSENNKLKLHLKNLKGEYKTDAFVIITTCNEDIIPYCTKAGSHTLFLTDHSSGDTYGRSQVTLQHTSVANLLDKVDDFLENDFLDIFAKLIHDYIDDCGDAERTRETIRIANAIYQRSGLPASERPKFKIGKISQVSVQIKERIVKIDQVIGCGEEGGVLIIDIKQKDCNNDETAKRLVEELLKMHGIVRYRICSPEIEKHARVEIQSGEACRMNSTSGTLGAFMIEDSRDLEHGGNINLSVICAGHVVENDDNAFIQAQNKNIGKVSCKYDGTGMDIAKVRVEDDILSFVDVRFQNEADETLITKLFENDPSSLAGRCVFLRGASTQLGRGKISSSRYISSDKCRILEIVKRSEDSMYAERGDSGATVLFLERKGKYLFAVGMHFRQLLRGHQLVYQALFLKDGIDHLMSHGASPPLRLASSCEVEPHVHFTEVAVVEITTKYIRGVKASVANIKDVQNICTNGKELELLPYNLKTDEIVEKAFAFVQPLFADGLHTIIVIGTDVIDKATVVTKFQNAAKYSGMTQSEAIGNSCTHNNTQAHVLLNVDDGKVSFFKTLSSQHSTKVDSFDVYNIIRSKCLKKLEKKYDIRQNDKRDDEIKNVVEQFERKLLTFNGDADILISVLDSRNVCYNAEPVDVMKVPKAVVFGILRKVCKEIEDTVLAAFTAHKFTGNAIFHVYGMLTLCPKLHEILRNTLGGNVTKCVCVKELPKRVLHKAGKRLKCKCAFGLEGIRKQSNYIPWKDLDSK
ncbi:uncharacterized protein LOC128204277 [Mya arenaria]|uniref:uncharacterized protein LOC128204277 n=1 Tax=Mya arenaria TaxID=6604 RepID=UPI0022E82A1D|nr:uncharacterized protein LOC128204277 [Mya arenaria]XP_052761648.1 uncharacterized protein LOC128204277 [Mya arenaria]XP_052761649.1 uncharacterized protein LOC128204277 [Mya arenaria]